MTLAPEQPPSHRDATVARAVGGIGGKWGRHAGVAANGWWTPIRVLIALTLFTLLLGFAQKSPCGNGDWTGLKQYTHGCYSDIVPLWSDERLDVGAVPYRDTAVEYPVLTGAFMWISAELTRGFFALTTHWSQLLVFDTLSSILLAVCALVVTVATARSAGRRPYDAAIFALSPLLIFHAFTNWDLLAMALTSGAIWAWLTRKPVLAGVLIGLGTAAKLYPVFLFLPLVVLAYRNRRWAETGWALAGAVASWSAVNVPVALAYHRGWWEFYSYSITRPVERSSIWAIVHTAFTTGTNVPDAGYWVPPGAAVACLLIAALLLVAYVGLRAPTIPQLGQLAFLVVLAFLLTTKVWSPQYSLWLVPLLALARPKWRMALLWQFCEIAVWLITLIELDGLDPSQGKYAITYGWLAIALVLRDVMLLAIAGLIVRDMWRVPEGGFDTAAEPPTQPPCPEGGFDTAAEPPTQPPCPEGGFETPISSAPQPPCPEATQPPFESQATGTDASWESSAIAAS